MSENEKNVTKRRFKEFENAEAWEQRAIKEIFKVTRGQVLAATETVENQTDEMPYPVYSSQTKNNGLMGYYKDFLFDTAITWTTDGANAGTVNYREGRFYSTNVNGVLLSDEGYANKAIAEALNQVAWKYVSRVGNPKLMNNVMGDIVISIPPTIDEQNKISNFFLELDCLITLNQSKLDKMKALKKAYLTEMFPTEGERKPKLRFAGFTDDWEQRSLSDIATMKARIGWQGLTKKEFLDEGDYYLITGTDFDNGQIDFKNIHFIGEDRYNQDTNIQIKNGDVLITKDGTIGKVAYVEGLDKPATLNAGVFVIKGKSENISNLYLYHYLAAPFLLEYGDKQATGGTIKHLNQNVLVRFPVPLPKIDEQRKIGKFFSSIDSLVTLHQRKLEKLQNIKKAYLNEMFI